MKILLLAPTFFGYRDRVAAEMSDMGHRVDVLNDRPSESTAFKSVSKLGYRLLDGKIDGYAGDLASLVARGGYDRVIYMGGMSFCFSRRQFERIRSASKAVFTAYLWDSFENCQRFAECLDLFDEAFSFEPTDCEKHGLRFRPLFFDRAYSLVPSIPSGGYEYDACFIGSVHQPSKFEAVWGICSQLEQMGLRVYRHFYMPSRSVEVLRKATAPAYRGVRFTGESLSSSQIAGIYAKSRAVIDSPQAGQGGLTMRTLEVLGARRKIITTNRDIVNYDFYDAGNVFVSEGGSVPNCSFFEGGFEEVPSHVLSAYSIQGFCRTLLGLASGEEAYRKAIA